MWIATFQPSGDLLRRPLTPELLGYDPCQRAVVNEFTGLGAARPVPGSRIGLVGPVTPPATFAIDLLTVDGARSSEAAIERID